MTPTLEEMTGWTPTEIEAAIRKIKPQGVNFECGIDREAGAWFVQFWQDNQGKKNILFEDWGFEQRIVYFNAYGWAWARQRGPTQRTSPWTRRQGEVTPQVVQRKAKASSIPDPADLDPNQIRAVYDRFREEPKKG